MRNTSTCRKRITGMLVAAMVFSQMPVSSMAAPVQAFKDIKSNVWYSDATNKWAQSGIVLGYEDGSFKPNQTVTRAEIASVIDRIFALQDKTEVKVYQDVEESKWYSEAIARVSACGIMNDFEDAFKPNQAVTREELAYALANIYKLEGQEDKSLLDEAQVATWAKEAVKALVTGGYMKGMPNGNFAPKAPLTRAELMVVIDRLNSEIIQEAGTYEEDIKGNLVVNAKDVVLKGMTVTGDLYLTGNIENLTLEESVIQGTIFIDHTKSPTTIKMTKGTTVTDVVADAVIKIIGQGEITTLYENVAGITSEVKPNQVVTAKDIQSTLNTTNSSSNGSSGGSSSSQPSGGSSSSNPVEDDDSESNQPNGGVVEENKPVDGDHVDLTKWKLVWNDEFEGTQVDPKKWTYNTGFMDLNEEKQVYKSENATVNEGMLKITAKKEDTTIDGTTYNYTSARMVSKGRYAQKYGKIEVRAKLPVGKSLWPAIWMLPENEEYTGWPSSGEIDIMESRGSVPNEVWGTLHYGDKKPNNVQSGSSYVFPEGERIDDFHTYGIEWQPGEIRWYVDGKLYQTQDRWYSIDPETGEQFAHPAPFDKEFHMLLNLALGGWYDGVGSELGVEDSIFEGGKEYDMEVDYVRFYESTTGNYPEAIDPDTKVPELPKDARKPLADGNMVYDSNYKVYGIQDNKEADLDFGEGWNLLQLSNYGGKALAAVEQIEGMPFAKINIEKAGTENYAIQLVQHTTVGRGRTYKLAFDAKAEGTRDIKFKVGGGEKRGYALYSNEYTETLDTNVQHIEKVFKVKPDTDTKARLEFNLGLDEKDVWIGNIRLEEIENAEVIEDFNAPKAPLKNGSLIYNGAFDKGKLDRLTYWNLELQNGAQAIMNVPEATRDLHIKMNAAGQDLSDINLNQKGLQLSEDGNYTVVFTGSAKNTQPINVKLVGEDGQTVYAENTVTLTTEKQKYEFALHGEGSRTDKGQLIFEMGGTAQNEIILDDISIVQTRGDFSDVVIFPLKNGDFSNGQEGWDGLFMEGAEGNVTFEEEAQFNIKNLGSNPWSVMLAQNNVPFSAGVKYIISFEASSEVPRDMIVKTEEEGTWRAFFEKNITLTPEKQKYSFEYTMPADGDKSLGLKFLMGTTAGAPDTAHSVIIDNIICEVKDGAMLKPPSNLLENGNFEKVGDFKWNAWKVSPAAAHFSYEEGAKVDITNSGDDTWQITLEQEGVSVKQGKTYCIEFDANVTTPSSLRVALQDKADKEYAGEYAPTIELYEGSHKYKYEFTVTKESASNLKFKFQMGYDKWSKAYHVGENQIILKDIKLYEKQ